MNKSAIKNYAVWARTELIKLVTQKAYEYEVTKESTPSYNVDSVHGRLLDPEEKKQLNELIHEVKKNGFDHVIEEAAYTWFNRFIALRYMEVNNYIPQRVRIFTNEKNEFKPELLSEAIHLDMDGLDKQRVLDYIENNDQEALYKYLLLTICNDMNQYLPDMFTSISDYKTLLFPDNLLKEDGVLARLIKDIDQDSWNDQVQIIGWLYQYYIQMPKDELIHAKKQYKNEDVPFVTQLFTPDWVVRYMVENSLGNYYLKINPNTELYKDWKYFIKNNSTQEFNHKKLEDIKILDPCMGSGHILVYAFDLLMSFYEEYGYSTRDAAVLILQNNLYGIDIDQRAYQLSYFALMMKARSYNRRILNLNIRPNIYCMDDISLEDDFIESVSKGDTLVQKNLKKIESIYSNANVFGSLLDVTSIQDDELISLNSYLDKYLKQDGDDLLSLLYKKKIEKEITPKVSCILALKQNYDCVITNPPYLNSSLMPKELKQFLNKNYKDCKSDIFAAFIKKCIQFTDKDGYLGMITPYVWMFISSYEKLRNYVLKNVNISSLIQLEYNAFEAACVPVATFVFHNTKERYKGNYIKLSDFKGADNQAPKTIEAINNNRCSYYYETDQENFSKIPGSPIAYWVGKATLQSFNYPSISSISNPRMGLATGNNDYYLRLWFEVFQNSIGFNFDRETARSSGLKWFPYDKGGEYRKWYGNKEYVVNWLNDGREMQTKMHPDGNRIWAHNFNLDYNFKKHLSWNNLTSGNISFRMFEDGFLFDSTASVAFFDKDFFYSLAYLNTKFVNALSKLLNPTLHFTLGDFSKLPFQEVRKDNVEQLSKKAITISKADWDSYETSWDFKVHPLVKNHVSTIQEAYSFWKDECNNRFKELKSNEEELNRIFIEIYGLQDELTPDESDKDVTVHYVVDDKDSIPESFTGSKYVRTKQDEIKSFISYAVGCMFGRYSLDTDGLAYAGGQWDISKYNTFIPDADNVIPICDEEYFEDDIVSRFVEFVRIVYGAEHLESNLQFISDALGGKGSPREVLRNYFLNQFYKDHCNTYQVTGSGKRPIYWLFDSGKKNGFKALVYIHRYTTDLIACMRTGYIHPLQSQYRTQIEMLNHQIDEASSTSERVKLQKQLKKITNQSQELGKYEEKIHHWADKMEPMDLDDGVKANYAKFQELLAKIK